MKYDTKSAKTEKLSSQDRDVYPLEDHLDDIGQVILRKLKEIS